MKGLGTDASGISLRLLGALVVPIMMVVHLQDYFGRHTAWFTVAFVGLWAAGVILIALGGCVPRLPDPRGGTVPWTARVGGAVACLGLLVFHLVPALHTPGRLALCGGAACLGAAACLVAGGRAARVAVPVAAASFLVMLTTPVSYQGTPFFLPRDAFFQVLSVGTFLFLAIASLLRLSGVTVLAGSLVASILMRVHGIDHHEVDAVHRDMLPLVQYAGEAFLEGRNPYTILFYANHDLPLTYLPVMWLTYLPTLVLGVDLRWTSIAATAIIAIVISRWSARAADGGRRLHPAMVAVATAFLFQPEVFWNAVHGEPIVYWLWLVLLLDAIQARRPWCAALLLGILLGARHFSILFVPFASLWFLASRSHFRIGLLRVLVAGTLGCLIVMPFFVSNPDSFLYGVYDWLVTYGPSRRSWWDMQIGFQQFFYHAGREQVLAKVQVAVMGLSVAASLLLAVRALIARRGHGERSFLTWFPLVVGYPVFVLFNSMIWKSFLFPVLLLLVFAGVMSRRRREDGSPAPSTWERTLLEPRYHVPVAIALAAVIGWSSLTLVRGFMNHRNLEDVGVAAHHTATRVLRPGDLLVDWGRVHAGHVDVPSVFGGLALPPDVRSVRRLRAHDVTAHERIVLFDGFSRFDPDRDFPDLVRVTSRRIGRISLHVFRPPHRLTADAWRLSRDPGAISGAFLVSDAPPTYVGKLSGKRWLFPDRPLWNYVGPTALRVVSRPLRCIWAHPADGLVLRIEVDVPRPGPAVLLTALDDKAIRPLFAPVHVRVLDGSGGEVLSLTHPNRPGRWFRDLGTIPAGHLAIEVWTGDTKMRHFGLDLAVSTSADP